MERTTQPTIRVPAQPDRNSPRLGALGPQLRVRHVYAPGNRPQVLVRVDGEWHHGLLRKWSQDPSGRWWGSVAWGRSAGTRFLDTFLEVDIWADIDGTPPVG